LNGMTPNEFEENYYKKNGLLTWLNQ
jgi:hypothetical protein